MSAGHSSTCNPSSCPTCWARARQAVQVQVAAVLDAHGVRGWDADHWVCWCSLDERHDDPDIHMAQALQRAGLLRGGA